MSPQFDPFSRLAGQLAAAIGVLTLLLQPTAAKAAEPPRPNIVIIMADDK